MRNALITKEDVVSEIERLRAELKTAEKVLRALEERDITKRTGPAMRFYRVRPLTAIKMMLRQGGPQTQVALTQQLIDGGITIGKKRAEHNIRISIEKTLRNGTLKQVGDLLGLPEWPEEKFKKERPPSK